MTERIFIGVAWPYANGPLHLGHVAGGYLPADIFARFHRTKGNQVLMVSGSDSHGTPITVLAEREGRTPAEVFQQYHHSFLESWDGLGISFDLFTHTDTENHVQIVQQIFLDLVGKGLIERATTPLFYCPNDRRFLPDRYVEGVCPNCGYERSRGDQCDNCGRPLNALELVNPRCILCGTTPEVRDSEHFFLKLSTLNDRLTEWVRQQTHWRSNVYKFTLNFLQEGLHDRSITRDLTWGVPIPLPGYDDKRIYVWFEAVIGYLSAAVEWAQLRGEPDAWEPYWKDPETRSYYFMGKDNIPFHTIIWPAILMGYDHGLNLPYDVAANEFLSIDGKQLSTSRNWAVWVPDYLERYAPDPLRYYMTIAMPESGDSDFSWREFVRRNNDELVAAYGNLVHRVLTFTYRNFEQAVPAPGPLDAADEALLARARETMDAVEVSLTAARFREPMRTMFELCRDANRYLDEKAPWKTLKQDRERTATTLHTTITVINALKKMFSPFLPFTSQQLHEMLGLSGTVQEEGWDFGPLPAGHALRQPAPLFTKLDEAVAEEETAKLGQPRRA